jgi:hypothetical protein
MVTSTFLYLPTVSPLGFLRKSKKSVQSGRRSHLSGVKSITITMATPIMPLRTLLRRTYLSNCHARPQARLSSTLAGPSRPTTPLTPYFAYSHRYHPSARTTTFFSPSFRRFTTAAFESTPYVHPVQSSASASTASTPTTSAAIPRSLPNWLFGCSALVFGIVVIGGLTRLTESGLSITEWEPFTGILPPISDAEWDVEREKYRVSPEGILYVDLSPDLALLTLRTNSKIDMSEFKKIFYMEWAHRVAGRALGVA